jgi:hypothetical protein
MIDPMRMCGMSRRSGYVLDCAVEGSSSGSLFSVRIMRPNAYFRVSNGCAIMFEDVHALAIASC